MTRLSWTSSAALSPRSRKRTAVRRLRAQGLYGPGFRDVLPGLAGVVVAVCSVVAGLAAGYRVAGIVVPVAGTVLLVLTITIVIRHRRPHARRRRGCYTPQELLELDTQGLALAVARMLRRDGWRVRLLPAPDRPRLCARHPDGRQLDVAFRPVAEPLPDEDLPHPHPHRGYTASYLHLVVHRGTFQARDIRWARRQENTHLLDGSMLRRWTDGTSLDELLPQER